MLGSTVIGKEAFADAADAAVVFSHLARIVMKMRHSNAQNAACFAHRNEGSESFAEVECR